MVGLILAAGLAAALAAQSPSGQPSPPSPCDSVLADALVDGAAAEICAGDEARRSADAAPADSAERARRLGTAAEHYRKAASIASKVGTKALALGLLADAYDRDHLDEPARMESALRELILVTPDDLTPVSRLSRLQEDEGLIEAAEATLLDARHRQPEAVGSNRLLAQFYARRVTALQADAVQAGTARNPGDPDENGVYPVGGALTPPLRLGTPKYPGDAQAAGIEGAVVAEIVIDTSGTVTDARIVRSVPLLDEAALKAVRDWRYEPTIVNGEAVPVRLVVTVNFTLR